MFVSLGKEIIDFVLRLEMPNLPFRGGFDGRVLGFLEHQREQEKSKGLEEVLGTKMF